MIIKKTALKKCVMEIGLSILLWIIIFDPPLIAQFNILHLMGVGAITYLAFKRIIRKSFLRIEIVLLMLYLYAVVVSVLNGNMELLTMHYIYWMLDIVPLAYVFWEICEKKNIDYIRFENILILSGLIAACLAFASLINSDIHDFFIQSLIGARYDAEYLKTWAHRSHGYASNLQFSSPIAMAMIALLSMNRLFLTNKIRYLFISGFLVAMAFVSARTSLIVFIAGTIVLCVLNAKKLRIIGKVAIIIVSGLLITFNSLENYIQTHSSYNSQIYWLYDGLSNIFSLFSNKVKVYYNSLEYFGSSNKYIFPDNPLNLLFGTSETIMSSNPYNVYSDIGYVNDIWFGGILYTVVIYMCFFYMVLMINRSIHSGSRRYDLGITLSILFAVLISNIKGIAFSFNNITSLIWIILIYVINKRKAKDKGHGTLSISVL